MFLHNQVYKNRLGDFFLACFLLAEGSTPFYNMRGVLKEVSFFFYQRLLKKTVLELYGICSNSGRSRSFA